MRLGQATTQGPRYRGRRARDFLLHDYLVLTESV
jgi:hypothetical protein